MKERIEAVIESLQNVVARDVRPGGSGEVAFRQAVIELENIAATPDPEPQRIIETTVATGDLAIGVSEHLAARLFGPLNDRLTAIDARLFSMESGITALTPAAPAA